MSPYYADDAVTVYAGDCLDVLRELPDASVDSVVTDPPYGIRFMGKAWDGAAIEERTQRGRDLHETPAGTGPNGGYRSLASEAGRYDFTANQAFQAWCTEWAAECLRVLKPGGHMLAFGGSRTWHRLTCAIEDAGFEIRDSIAWLYGSGFPKSLDVSKAIDKAAPRVGMFDAFAVHFQERRKASGLTQKDVARHFPSKTGGITGCVWNWENGANVPTLAQWETLAPMLGLSSEWLPLIERVEAEREKVGEKVGYKAHYGGVEPIQREFDLTAPATPDAQRWQGWGTALKPAFEPIVVARKPLAGTVAANVLTHGTGALNIEACRVEAQGRPLIVSKSEPSTGILGDGLNGSSHGGTTDQGRWPSNVVLDESQAAELDRQSGNMTPSFRNGDRRADSMFFGASEQSRQQTGAGYGDSGGASRFFPTFRYEPKAPTTERPRDGGTAHPTVKPLDLMRWLVRLVTPPGGTVLEPFAGSGTTAEACIVEGFNCIAIEREADYLPLIVQRLSKPIQVGLDFGEVGI